MVGATKDADMLTLDDLGYLVTQIGTALQRTTGKHVERRPQDRHVILDLGSGQHLHVSAAHKEWPPAEELMPLRTDLPSIRVEVRKTSLIDLAWGRVAGALHLPHIVRSSGLAMYTYANDALNHPVGPGELDSIADRAVGYIKKQAVIDIGPALSQVRREASAETEDLDLASGAVAAARYSVKSTDNVLGANM